MASFAVEYENGDSAVAHTDQREIARWESDRGTSVTVAVSQTPHVFARFAAFHALRRTGRVSEGLTFEAWCDTVVAIRDA